jgi:hypothetical protein
MSFKIKLNVDRTVREFYPGLTRDEVYVISEQIEKNWDYSNLIDEVKTLTEQYAKADKIDLEGKDGVAE